LELYNNQLNGPIPATIGNLLSLKAVDLSLNQLIGSIPASLAKLSSLELLYLNDNPIRRKNSCRTWQSL
jgi:Leucine-rich repeat (LRR) protein